MFKEDEDEREKVMADFDEQLDRLDMGTIRMDRAHVAKLNLADLQNEHDAFKSSFQSSFPGSFLFFSGYPVFLVY